MFLNKSVLVVFAFISISIEEPAGCRDRSSFFRQDGELCFEVPPWQHQPVQLDKHIGRLRSTWGASNVTGRRQTTNHLGSSNSEISRYMDTVIAPFLDTYHRNIQNSYQQLTSKILRRIKEEVNAAMKKKQEIYKDLTQLADNLGVPELCNEERRAARTVASSYVSQIYDCTEEAKSSIAKMGKYAEEMISITKNHMQMSLGRAAQTFDLNGQGGKNMKKSDIEKCLQRLSRAAVTLGYELDLSLTNARRHNEQSCERLTGCSSRARKRTEESNLEIRDLLQQCVYS